VIQPSNQSEGVEVIIPHRGNLPDLETALWYLKRQKVTPEKVSVCFDEFATERHFQLAEDDKKTHFYINFPSGAGPYPSRDILARATDEQVIVFHDSDDISTINRVGVLMDYLKNENIDAVGSQELRVNKLKQQIEAIRYPLDVRRDSHKSYPIFFPTTAIKKTAYLKSGGLSTVRKHSSDTQFYQRAHFFMNLKNVDEFLYIRVKHENSLTTAPKTALNSIVRERLRKQWWIDFLKVRFRNMDLLESTLVDEPSVADFDLIPLNKTFQEEILTWQKLTLSLRAKSRFANLEKPIFPDEKAILEHRLSDYKKVDSLDDFILKESFSWRIGWAITRVIKFLLGWIPFVRKRL